MSNKNSKLVVTFLIALLITAGLSCGQEGNSNEQNRSDIKDHNVNHETMMDSDNKEMMNDNKPIVHGGTIDLAAIDENGDGKVYQDQMCWNVISDKAGDCPQCGMKLKEVSLEEAKINLEKNDYEVK